MSLGTAVSFKVLFAQGLTGVSSGSSVLPSGNSARAVQSLSTYFMTSQLIFVGVLVNDVPGISRAL